jgi:hypothetical protein
MSMAAQKINKLNTFFEVKNISIKKEEAIITILLYSNSPQNSNVGLRFYLEDEKTKAVDLLSPTFYWVDRYTINLNEENVWTGNEDVNLFKEIVFKIDITNQNRSTFNNLRWIRDFRFLIKSDSVTNASLYTTGEILLRSENVKLISSLVPIPQIKHLDIRCFDTDDTDRSLEEIAVSIYYDYGIESDFNYINKNIEYKFQLLNYRNLKPFDQRVLSENGTLDQSSKLGVIKYTFTGLKTRTPVLVNVIVTDKQGNHLANYIKLYTPIKPKNKVYVKFNGVVKEVTYIYSNFTEDKVWSDDSIFGNQNSVFVSN